LLEFADPVRGKTADTFGELRRTRCSKKNLESGFLTRLTTASLSPQPNLVAYRSRAGAVTIDAREQVSGTKSMQLRSKGRQD